jgi:splicing factor 3B subunit 3
LIAALLIAALLEYLTMPKMAPLSYVPLEYACNFASDQCPEGIVAISGPYLRIAAVEKLGDAFNQVSIAIIAALVVVVP